MTDMPSPPPAAGIGREKAEIGARIVARIIDWAIGAAIFVPIWIVSIILGQISGALGLLFFILGALVAIAAFVYIFMWGLGETGQTPGKRMQGVAVLDATTGQVIGGPKGIGRELLNGIINSVCYIGYIWIFVDAENQALYDKAITANAYKAEKGSIMPIFPGGMPF